MNDDQQTPHSMQDHPIPEFLPEQPQITEAASSSSLDTSAPTNQPTSYQTPTPSSSPEYQSTAPEQPRAPSADPSPDTNTIQPAGIFSSASPNTTADSAQPGATPTPFQAVAAPQKKIGLAVTSLVLGIVALLSGLLGIIAVIIAIVAIAFGVFALIKHQSKGISIAGLVLGVVALPIAIFMATMQFAFFSAVDDIGAENSSEALVFDIESVYDNIETGMTKEQVEDMVGDTSKDCVSEDEALEQCDYETSSSTLTVFYTKGEVSGKTMMSTNL